MERYAAQPITRKTLNTLAYADLSDDSLLVSANYVRNELPIRLSHRIVEMKRLPYFVLTTPSLHHVHRLYIDAFTKCSTFPPIVCRDDEIAFHDVLKRVISDSAQVIDLVANGLIEARRLAKRLGIPDDGTVHLQLQEWVEVLMASRIGRRVFTEQHIALHEAVQRERGLGAASQMISESHLNGIVDTECDVNQCLEQAVRAAKRVSVLRYGVAPEVKLSGCETAFLPIVRAHLEYVLFELLKNAMRATVEYAGGKMGHTTMPIENLPDVHVFMAEGPSELTIRLSDAGGGLRREERDKVFEYGYTTVGEMEEASAGSISDNLLGNALSDRGSVGRESPMAGLGFGLPMSR